MEPQTLNSSSTAGSDKVTTNLAKRETEDETKKECLAATVAPISKGKPLVMLQVNYKSIYNKTLYFWNLIYTYLYNHEVVTGTESWLSEEISNAEVFRADNTTFRTERQKESCGGMFV
jgi:hypothetical protein